MRANDWDPIREKHYGQRPCAAQTGRTHDRTDQCCSNVKKALANQAPSTHDPERTYGATHAVCTSDCEIAGHDRRPVGRGYPAVTSRSSRSHWEINRRLV